MKNKNIIHIDSCFDYTELVTEILFKKIQSLEQNSSGKIYIALSGGNTPLPILEKLCNKKLNWEKFVFFLVDERCVPNQDESSNYGNIKKIFYNSIPSESYSIVKNGKTYQESTELYGQEIIQNVPFKDEVPSFDLILLGMGDDGHTASLFPNTFALKENKKFVVLNEVPQLNTSRITLTYPVLKNAKEVLVLMKGEQKEQIMNQMYSEENISYPMYKVIQEQNNLSWIISK